MKRLRREPCRTPMFEVQGRLEEEELARETTNANEDHGNEVWWGLR